MNKNDECDIVKDLAVPYAENLINNKSKLFVEEHLKTCDNCKTYYQDINSNILNETQTEKRKEKSELDFLKKIRKTMNILKMALIGILIIICIIILILFIKYQIVNRIINNAYSKIEYLKTLDNYNLTDKMIEIKYEKNDTYEITSNYYYKNGKYKNEYGNTVHYFEDNSYNDIYVYNDIKQIDYCTQDFIKHKKGEPFDGTFNDIISYKTELLGIFKLLLSVRIDNFNGIDCYVIKYGNDNSYREIWIDKETNIVLRTIEEVQSSFRREHRFTLIENEVTDEDVDSSILESEQYKDYIKKDIIFNATKEMKDIYTLEN